MKQNINLSAPDREIYRYMKEDQHRKEVVQAEPSYDKALHCSCGTVLFQIVAYTSSDANYVESPWK